MSKTKQQTQEQNGTLPETAANEPQAQIVDVGTAEKVINEFKAERLRRYMAECNALDQKYGLTIGFQLYYTDDGRTQAMKVVKELEKQQ